MTPIEAADFLRKEMKKDPVVASMGFQLAERKGHTPDMDGFLAWASDDDNTDQLILLASGVAEMDEGLLAMQAYDAEMRGKIANGARVVRPQ